MGLMLLIPWVICYSRSKAPRFVRYFPIVALAIIVLQTIVNVNQVPEAGDQFNMNALMFVFAAILLWLFCALLGWQATTKSSSGIVFRATASSV